MLTQKKKKNAILISNFHLKDYFTHSDGSYVKKTKACRKWRIAYSELPTQHGQSNPGNKKYIRALITHLLTPHYIFCTFFPRYRLHTQLCFLQSLPCALIKLPRHEHWTVPKQHNLKPSKTEPVHQFQKLKNWLHQTQFLLEHKGKCSWIQNISLINYFQLRVSVTAHISLTLKSC